MAFVWLQGQASFSQFEDLSVFPAALQTGQPTPYSTAATPPPPKQHKSEIKMWVDLKGCKYGERKMKTFTATII